MKIRNLKDTFLLLLQTAYLVAGIVFCVEYNIFSMPRDFVINISMDLVGIAVCLIIFFSFVSAGLHEKSDRLCMAMFFSEATVLFLDIAAWIVQGRKELSAWNLIINTLFYEFSTIFPYLGWSYQIEVMKLKGNVVDTTCRIVRVLFTVAVVLIIVNVFGGFYFTINFETGLLVRGEYFIFCLLFFAVMAVVSLFFLFFKTVGWRIKASFIVINLLPALGTVIQTIFFGFSIVYICMMIGLLFVYVNLEIDYCTKINSLKNHLLVNQIKPQFLLDTLSKIEKLSKESSSSASVLSHSLSVYLQGNLEVIENDELVPFAKEIDFLKNYIQIQKVDYENISFELDFEDRNFFIPLGSVQAIVENAIKHGVQNQEGACIKLKSFTDGKMHFVQIIDNGKGFDIDEYERTMEKVLNASHTGIRKLQKRLEYMCSGTLELESELCEGTTVTISIPDEEWNSPVQV